MALVRMLVRSPPQIHHPLGGLSDRSLDLPGQEALFNSPVAVVARPNGVIVVCDRRNRCLRAIRQDGRVILLAGMPSQTMRKTPPRDGPTKKSEVVGLAPLGSEPQAPPAILVGPRGVAVLSDGSLVFSDGEAVRVLANGEITTVAGQLETSGCSDGVGSAALFRTPTGVLERAPGKVLIADRGNHRICELDLTTLTVTTVAGTGERGWLDSTATRAKLDGPAHLCRLADNTIAVTDCVGNRVRRLISPESDDQMRVQYNSVTQPLIVKNEELKQQVLQWEDHLRDAKGKMAECVARIRHLSQRLLSTSFQVEAERAAAACLNQSATEEELCGLVMASPSLSDLRVILAHPRLPRTAGVTLSDALKMRVEKNTHWDLCSARQGAMEMAALSEMVLANPHVVGASVVALTFGNKSFRLRFPQPCPHTLGLLEATVRSLTGHSTSEEITELERAVRAWLRESFTPGLFFEVVGEDGKSINQRRPAEDVLAELFERWAGAIEMWERTGMNQQYPLASKWLVATHVGGLCSDATRALGLVVALPRLIDASAGLPMLEEVLQTVLMKVVEVSRPADVLARMELSSPSVGEPLGLRFTVPAVLRVLEKIIPLRKAKNDLEREEFREIGEAERRKQTTLLALIQGFEEATMVRLMQHLNVWSPFIRWGVSVQSTWFGHHSVDTATWNAFSNTFTVACDHFRNGFADLEAGALGVNATKTVLGGAKDNLVPLFHALELVDPELLVSGLHEDISSAFVEIDQVKTIATKLLPSSLDLQAILRYQDVFTVLTVQQMRWLLGRETSSGKQAHFAKLWNPPQTNAPEPFAKVLVRCVDWILHQDLLGSTLFEFVWDALPPKRGPESILAAAQMIRSLAESIDQQTVSFGDLRLLVDVMDSANLARLSAARHGVSQDSAWQAVEVDFAWVASITESFADWQHLRNVCDNAESIHDVLCMVSVFSTRKCRAAVEGVHSTVTTLQKTAVPNFNTHQLSELAQLAQLASSVHRSLPSMNADLVAIITGDSLDLIDWLRAEFVDDKDFTSAIEIAVGRSEMECPVELWESGTPGRVAEEKLSQLASVRTFLYPLAFRLEDSFESIDGLLQCIAAVELERTDEKIKQMIVDTNTLLIPLTELLSDQTDSSATNRLVQMMIPERGATWLCEGGLSDGCVTSSDLALTFTIPRATQSFTKLLKLPEILDWQSQIVLSSRGNQITPQSQAVVAAFVSSLDAAKELSTLLLKLHQAGHFDYQEPWCESHTVADPDALRAEVVRLKDVLWSWVAHSSSVRSFSYFLNFFSMRQVFLLAQHLRGKADQDSGEQLLQILHATVTKDAGDREGALLLLGQIQKHFLAARTDMLPASVLTACATALDAALMSSPVRMRPIQAAQREKLDTKDLKAGLNVAVSSDVMELVVSSFARVGRLPERESLVFCHETPIEVLTNLVQRWKSAIEQGRCPLYCIVSPDTLPLGHQTELSVAIRDAQATQKTKAATLLLICSNDISYIASQFEAQMVTTTSLPADILRQIGSEISNSCRGLQGPQGGRGVTVYHSVSAGAGKSFAVRTQCAQIHYQRVHVPVNGALTSAQLLNRIGDQAKAAATAGNGSAGKLLHLDLSSSVKEQFDFAMFELTILGSLVDTVSGRAFSWHPEETSIAVEVASGNLLGKLHTCAILDLHKIVVGAPRFVTDEAGLAVGMGEDFSNPQFDGCVTGPRQVGVDAYGRLTFVVKTLQLHKEMGGSFPPEFKPESVTLCNGQTAYSLLIKASKMTGRPSLWCVWSFVNVMYWQMREMSDPEGPIQGAVLPDPNAETADLDIAIKQQIKGQLVAFAERTATEFATRQTNDPGPDRIIGFYRSGMEKSEFNGRWTQMNYETDGHPVFQKFGNSTVPFLTYFRAGHNDGKGAWVIDDVIAPVGPVYSSTEHRAIHACWMTIPNFKPDKAFQVKLVKDSRGHRGQAVQVSGSKEADENGVYLRQPAYDDIDNNPHYIYHIADSSKRKHLFSDSTSHVSVSYWVICPQCNQDEGTDAISVGKELCGMWMTMPPLQRERHVTTTWIYASGKEVSAATFAQEAKQRRKDQTGDDTEDAKALPSPGVGGMPPGVICSACKQVHEPDEYCLPPDGYTAQWEPRKQRWSLQSIKEPSKIQWGPPGAAYQPEGQPELEPEPEPMPEPKPEPEMFEEGMLGTESLKKWGDSNHEAMLFSNQTHTVTFLSQNPKKMKEAMHPNLISHLEANLISVGEALDALNGRFAEILSALTNISRTKAEASQLLPDYQLTGDALLKMLAIYVRVRCGIPVILMGECGCGKTYLISFLCAWLGTPLCNLDVHGGTTESDIVETFAKATAHLEKPGCHEVFVFLDEVNTCAHMGLITEAICSRSLNGQRLPAGVKVLAAVNPHRRRAIQDESEGLVFNLGGEHEVDPMASLVYRVHPVPLTLEGFVFDFGALSSTQENLYIDGMVKSMVAGADSNDRKAVTLLIASAQNFCREAVGDPSAVSLRDVKRCLCLLKWFQSLPPRAFTTDKDATKAAKKAAKPALESDDLDPARLAAKRPLALAATLAIAHVYWYRHGKASDRAQFWDTLSWQLSGQLGRGVHSTCFASLISQDPQYTHSRSEEIPFAQTVQTAQERFCSRIEVESGIAMNEALSENLFVVIVCIINRIPVFLVGKPGSSKTLTLQILANNLNGEQSAHKFWRCVLLTNMMISYYN